MSRTRESKEEEAVEDAEDRGVGDEGGEGGRTNETEGEGETVPTTTVDVPSSLLLLFLSRMNDVGECTNRFFLAFWVERVSMIAM